MEASRWSTFLSWVGGAFLLAGLFAGQFLAIAAGLIVLGVGVYWVQDNWHSEKQGP
jgi:hypothetical protein